MVNDWERWDPGLTSSHLFAPAEMSCADSCCLGLEHDAAGASQAPSDGRRWGGGKLALPTPARQLHRRLGQPLPIQNIGKAAYLGPVAAFCTPLFAPAGGTDGLPPDTLPTASIALITFSCNGFAGKAPKAPTFVLH